MKQRLLELMRAIFGLGRVQRKISIPPELYEKLTEGNRTLESRLRNAAKWVILEEGLRRQGGGIFVQEKDGPLTEIV